MKHTNYQSSTAHKNTMPSSEEQIENASFLTIEPQGEVWPSASDAIYAVVDIPSANEWSIVAHFPLSPCWVVISFEKQDRDAAFEALLRHKKSRPLYYRDARNCIELHGRSVAEVLEELRSKGIGIDAIDHVDERQRQEWG